MQVGEFKIWLEQRGAQTAAGRNTRVHAIRTIEKNLAALGSPHADLQAAWDADRFESLRQRLAELREDFIGGGTEFQILMPESKRPLGRLLSWRSWLGQYGQFLSGEPAGGHDADRIREHVLEHYIEPAREKDEASVDVLVSDVNAALGLNQAWPNICQALNGRKFLELADVGKPEQIGADQSSATVFRFDLGAIAVAATGSDSGRPFILFDVAGDAFKPVRNHSRQSGRSAFRIKPAGASNKADEAIELDTMTEVAKAMLVDRRPARVQSVRGGPVNYFEPPRDCRRP